MESIVHTRIDIGLEKPVKILHVTDVHISKADERDTPRQQKQAVERVEVFRKEGGFPPKMPEDYFRDAVALAKEENALLVCTGDAIDLHTHACVDFFLALIKDVDMMFAPGGHEHQRRFVRTMEEEYPYVETVRPKLEEEFSRFDLYLESRVINGLNIVTLDNSLDYFPLRTVEAFRKELEKGLPIIAFFHDYLWDTQLNMKEAYHPNVRLTPEDYRISHEMMSLLCHHPLVIATFSGHGHRDEVREINGKKHYMTDGLFRGSARMIEIV